MRGKLGILSLALPFSFLFLFSYKAMATQVDQGRFVFKIIDKVYSVRDLKVFGEDLKALECHLGDGIINDYLGKEFVPKLTKSLQEIDRPGYKISEHSPMVIFLNYVRQIYKLKIYVNSQKITVVPGVLQGLKEQKECPNVFSKKGIHRHFLTLLRLEIYLRGRYGQASGQDKMSEEQKKKSFESLALFIDSLEKQMTHENFW